MEESEKKYKNSLFFSIAIPAFFMAFAWIIFIYEKSGNTSLSEYGLLPRNLKHWYGIFTMPFLHGDFSHIFNNTLSFIILGTLLFYFYPKHSGYIFLFSYIICGILTWFIGRNNYHIGASAMIYAFAAYIITSGMKNRNKKLLIIALIVIFVNGGMVWGILPQNTGISWEGHLSGAICGVGLAFVFIPPKELKIPSIDTTEQLYTKFKINDYDSTENFDVEINYFYKKENKY